jgi:hypothetical protein
MQVFFNNAPKNLNNTLGEVMGQVELSTVYINTPYLGPFQGPYLVTFGIFRLWPTGQSGMRSVAQMSAPHMCAQTSSQRSK